MSWRYAAMKPLRFFALLLAPLSTAFAADELPTFSREAIGIPPLSLQDQIKRTPPPLSFGDFSSPASSAPSLTLSPPRATVRPSAPPRAALPLVEPDPSIDFKVRIIPPDPNVDFALRVQRPADASARQR